MLLEGQGGNVEVESKSDLRMIRLAMRQRWPITPELKAKAVETIDDFLTNGSPRDKTAALKTLAQMEGQNQSDDHKSADWNDIAQQLVRLAIEHGADPSIFNIECDGPEGDSGAPT